MPILSSTARDQGASIVTTLPAEVVRRLDIAAGERLYWIGDGLGWFRVVPQSDGTDRAVAAHEEVMSEYEAVFRQLPNER